MASLSQNAPLHVELLGPDDFEPEVRIGGGKTIHLTLEELIILSYCRVEADLKRKT